MITALLTIILEQAGGKKGSQGCGHQLLVYKKILEQVRNNRRDLLITYDVV